MSPLSLVGIILVTLSPSLADVSHVLDGSAHPPDPQAVNHLATPEQYWWMNSNSPLKAAYDYYKKCNAKGNCITPINPDAAPQPFQPQPHPQPLDVKHNPFLNGKYNPQENTAKLNEGGNIDIAKNPFLSGKVVTSGGGDAVVKGQDGFLGVQPAQPFKKPGFATTHPLDAKKKPGFATTHPLEKTSKKTGVECKGAGFGCVEKKLCVNGVVNKNGEGLLQTRSDVHYCTDEEVCCQLNNLNEITQGKSSVPGSTIKFAGGAGFSPGFIHVQPLNVQPDIVFAGEHGHHSSSSTSKSIRDTSLSPNSVFSSTVDYSDTKFDSDVRFASTFQGPAYLPPVAPTTPKPKPFEQSSIDNHPQPPYRPSPSIPQPSPQPRPRPTSPPFRPTPSIPQFPSPSTPQYTPAPPQPQQPTGGYEYPKPTPTFGYPTPRPGGSSSNVNNQYVPPPKKPTEGDQSSDAANLDGTILRPTTPRAQFQGELNTAPPPGCAAALKCVQEIYCTAEGVISPVPVVLTKEQELSRVPTTVCQDTESGIIGKCCRDPNYKDPWPSANLVNGVDDGQYKEDDSIGQYSPDLQRNVRSETGGPRQDASNINVNVQQPQPKCGERHPNTSPKGPGPLDVNFAEIPWQAMVLRDSNRSLLCGGAIIRRNAVITAAHCVEGLETSDILVKGGEWKLGIDEEPLPFQIVKVAVVVRHPQYQPGSFVNDLALLVLEEKLRPSKNIGTLCLPPPNQIPTENCIATGWGKRILQLHAKGAIMHSINVNVMDNQQCQETLKSKFQHAVGNHSPNTLCGYSDIDQCKVDYGSAMACYKDGGYTLSGIYAWDTGCKQEGQIGGYVAPDVDWIESTLAKPITELKKLEH
ncbi:serine protease H164 [Tribolium castaneum]|uniref:Serine protease H164 n=1 Tax=Tribolium castaneum TaxID=7070 RepID=D2A6A6_TRICA|nr:serine protease H164 [Tribolium castaneum]